MKTQLFLYTTLLVVLVCFVPSLLLGQSNSIGSHVSGNFQVDAQYYRVDSAIGALPVPEKMMMNSWANITYTSGNFNAGLRYETYLNPVNGYDPRYKGTGVPYWFVDYKTGQFQVTAGHIYEQFGSGLVFRTYEEHNLGYDNSLNGIRIKFSPMKGVEIKGIYGTQRFYWDKGPGIVRGADADFNLNEMIESFGGSKLRVQFGGSFISKYEADEQIYNKYNTYNGKTKESELLILPLNVGASAGRVNLAYGNFGLSGEYAQKINDPNDHNDYIYKKGEALLLTLSYNQKGFGAFVQAKRLDNMTFKSKRTGADKALDINYLPAITKQQTYTLAALYPYGTIPNDEMGMEAQLNYKIKKDTWLGGHYGTDLALNFSAVNSIVKNALAADTIFANPNGTLGYTTEFFKIGNTNYYRDMTLEIGHKFSKSFKLLFTYMYEGFNIKEIQNHDEPYIHAHILVSDMTYKITPTKAIRLEAQALMTKQDQGNWVYGLLEYSIAPKWFVSMADLYNSGNADSDKRYHYPMVALAYNNDANRIQVSYGRQREGVVCVGGVCRNVPAANGLTISITSSF
ncbi:MAG: DUF6029 family protein [Bacteroidota bacterium]